MSIEASKLSTWVDPDLCTGSGLCVELVPSVFVIGADNLVKVKRGKDQVSGPDALVEVPKEHHEKVMEAAENCPAECIFIEIE